MNGNKIYYIPRKERAVRCIFNMQYISPNSVATVVTHLLHGLFV